MRTEQELIDKLKDLNQELITKAKEYSELDQISMQGSEGNLLNTFIQRIKGEINALTWVLK